MPPEINLLNDNGQYFKLKDIATIKFTAAKQISKASIEATDGIVLMIIGQFNADTVAITKSIDQSLSKLKALIRSNKIELHDQIFRPANYILKSLESILDHLVLGGCLVLIVLIIFISPKYPKTSMKKLRIKIKYKLFLCLSKLCHK